ncbi:MAG: ThiF family adenylyltransferase, partial [Acidobacteriota bacterium]|nr:ThiF family adenylyltransferase [Acidobacteriota bacterium]
MRDSFNDEKGNGGKPPVFQLSAEVLEEVVKTIGSLNAESGGVGGGTGEVVNCFHFDESSRNSAVTYSPDHRRLNHLFETTWNPAGVRLQVIFHSHPGRMRVLSGGDEIYAERILKAIKDLQCLWLPIINTFPDTGMFRMTPWAVSLSDQGVSIVKGKVLVINGQGASTNESDKRIFTEKIKLGVLLDEILIEGKKAAQIADHKSSTSGSESVCGNNQSEEERSPGQTEKPAWISEAKKSFNVRQTFDRVQQAYDIPLMQKSRIIAVGAGGAAEWLEQIARTGVGQFVLIDPDHVSETNLATQQTYRRDIGRPKVDCIAERIRDINPTARVLAIQKSLDDLSDDEMRNLCANPIDGCQAEQSIICGLTDSFFAQARVNRLALKFGLPSLCAQVYKEGRGAEITFTYPGVTPACHRCILSSRYQHFTEMAGENDVTSHGTPIFATARLNALKGFIILAMLHHRSGHPRWDGMLSRIGKRNLIQIRMDPDFRASLGLEVFDRVFEKADRKRLFFDEVVWLPQDQECPETGYARCPDCLGTGDLRELVGRIGDTRLDVEARDVGNRSEK